VRKIILYSAVSIDAMIAPPDGSVDWLSNPRFSLPGEDFGYAAFLRTIDTTVMGYTTYRQVLTFGEFPYPDKQNLVLTRSTRRRVAPFVRFISRNAVGDIRQLQKERGKGIWLVGGGQVNALLMNAGLVDRMVLTTIPVILGGGIPLFLDDVQPRKFVLRKRSVFRNGFVQATWDRRPGGKK